MRGTIESNIASVVTDVADTIERAGASGDYAPLLYMARKAIPAGSHTFKTQWASISGDVVGASDSFVTIFDLGTSLLLASLDAVITAAGGTVLTTSLDAALQRSFTLSCQLSAIIKGTVTKTASLDSILIRTGSAILAVQLDALLAATTTLTASLDAALKHGLSLTASTDAILQKTLTLQCSLDALFATLRTCVIDAIVTGAPSLTVNLDAFMGKTYPMSVGLDAVLNQKWILATPATGLWVPVQG